MAFKVKVTGQSAIRNRKYQCEDCGELTEVSTHWTEEVQVPIFCTHCGAQNTLVEALSTPTRMKIVAPQVGGITNAGNVHLKKRLADKGNSQRGYGGKCAGQRPD